ncbi:hypothetical protein COOONC_10340 [Cooperia oncophora]
MNYLTAPDDFSLLFIKKYRVVYTIVQVTSVLAYALFFGCWIIANRTTETMVFCVITAPLGSIYPVCMRSMVIIDLLIVFAYALFLCMLKKVRMSYDKMKTIYRSLIVISLAVVLGSLSTCFGGVMADALQLEIERANVDLVTGLFINSACSINIFIFYAVSKDYRAVFREYLFCSHMKNASYTPDSRVFTKAAQALTTRFSRTHCQAQGCSTISQAL